MLVRRSVSVPSVPAKVKGFRPGLESEPKSASLSVCVAQSKPCHEPNPELCSHALCIRSGWTMVFAIYCDGVSFLGNRTSKGLAASHGARILKGIFQRVLGEGSETGVTEVILGVTAWVAGGGSPLVQPLAVSEDDCAIWLLFLLLLLFLHGITTLEITAKIQQKVISLFAQETPMVLGGGTSHVCHHLSGGTSAGGLATIHQCNRMGDYVTRSLRSLRSDLSRKH